MLGWHLLMLTVVGDIGDLEAPSTVGFTGFEVDPELPGAGSEGNGSLIGLAGLVGGDGGWGGCREQQGDTGCWLPISRAAPSFTESRVASRMGIVCAGQG